MLLELALILALVLIVSELKAHHCNVAFVYTFMHDFIPWVNSLLAFRVKTNYSDNLYIFVNYSKHPYCYFYSGWILFLIMNNNFLSIYVKI